MICHCYSQLSAYFSDPRTNACPTTISGNLARTNRATSAKRFYSLPGQEEGIEQESETVETEDVEEEHLGDSETVCPAQSHLCQCTCNLELELAGKTKQLLCFLTKRTKAFYVSTSMLQTNFQQFLTSSLNLLSSVSVSEKPVDIFEQTPETDIILRNLGNFPIHIRQAQNWSSSTHNSSQEEEKAAPKLFDISPVNSDFPNVDLSVINQEDQNKEIKLVRI